MMKREEILTLLRQGKTVSGEELSRRFALSRTAVWKTVDALRRDGYAIEARTGLGYRLTGTPDTLTETEIRSFLGPTRIIGRKLLCFDEIDSTNTYLKKYSLTDTTDGTVAVANGQTAGRGRMERTFQSPKDKGIYLSVLLRPQLPPKRLLPVTAMTGVAVCAAVERICGVRPGLKWPNDPILGNRKLCGILTEMSWEGESGRLQCLVVGIGVNVSQEEADFSPEVAKMATSIVRELGRPVSRPALAAAMIEELDGMYAALLSGDLSAYLAAFRRDCVNLGRRVRLVSPQTQEEEVATATGIDERFGLIVRDSTGQERTICSGEVSVRGLYGYLDEEEKA